MAEWFSKECTCCTVCCPSPPSPLPPPPTFHPSIPLPPHLRCVICQQSLPKSYYRLAGQPYCKDHFYEKTAHKCQKCNDYITGPTMVCRCLIPTLGTSMGSGHGRQVSNPVPVWGLGMRPWWVVVFFPDPVVNPATSPCSGTPAFVPDFVFQLWDGNIWKGNPGSSGMIHTVHSTT